MDDPIKSGYDRRADLAIQHQDYFETVDLQSSQGSARQNEATHALHSQSHIPRASFRFGGTGEGARMRDCMFFLLPPAKGLGADSTVEYRCLVYGPRGRI
jgi:hypothetical protein